MDKIYTDGIIFDMDGTIWDNTPVFAPSWERACKDMGYDVKFTQDKLKGLFGKTMDEIALAIVPDGDDKDRKTIMHKSIEYENDDLAKSDEDITYDGVVETLYTLFDMGAKLAIVSNCQEGYIELFMKKTGVEEIICDTECYGHTGHGKADNIRAVVERQGFKNPVYVGDTEGDMLACQEAGVPFAWVAYGFGEVLYGLVIPAIPPQLVVMVENSA